MPAVNPDLKAKKGQRRISGKFISAVSTGLRGDEVLKGAENFQRTLRSSTVKNPPRQTTITPGTCHS